MDSVNQNKKHNVILKSRRELMLDGVSDVLGFDEREVSLMTEGGGLTVEGEELRITKMSLETGEVMVVGTVSGLYYESPKEKPAGSFFTRFKK